MVPAVPPNPLSLPVVAREEGVEGEGGAVLGRGEVGAVVQEGEGGVGD